EEAHNGRAARPERPSGTGLATGGSVTTFTLLDKPVRLQHGTSSIITPAGGVDPAPSSDARRPPNPFSRNPHKTVRTPPCALARADGGPLRATHSWSDPAATEAVLYVHGFGSRRSGDKAAALEEACAARGWTWLAADFRGHGESTGTLLELRGSGLQRDLDV